MSMRTPLGRVRGLGSAKSGTEHFWVQRVTAVALVPLTLWFVYALISLAGADHAAVSAWLRAPLNAVLMIALIAATLGFLPFNFLRASIFLGDSGAHLLGYSIAVLAVIGGAKIATALLVLGIPILDVAWAVIRRWRAGGAVSRRDTDHLHHRLLRAGLPQPIVVLSYYAVSAGFGLIALYLHKTEKLVALGTVAVLMVVILLILARTDPGNPAPGEPARSKLTD